MDKSKTRRILEASIVEHGKTRFVWMVDIKKSCRRRGVGNLCHRQDCLLRCVGLLPRAGYFSRIKTWMGVPWKSQCSRS